MVRSLLATTDGPSFHAWQGTAFDLAEEVLALRGPGWGGFILRWLRADRMRTREGLFNEWAAAAQFPPYFGLTWDAFRDCLADLPGEGYAFFLLEADQLLQDAPPDQGEILLEILRVVAEEVSPRPFHVVFQAQRDRYDTLVEGLRGAGVPFSEV